MVLGTPDSSLFASRTMTVGKTFRSTDGFYIATCTGEGFRFSEFLNCFTPRTDSFMCFDPIKQHLRLHESKVIGLVIWKCSRDLQLQQQASVHVQCAIHNLDDNR